MLELPQWTVTVVVPVYNGGKTIRATIEHLLRQSFPPVQIIVVDDGSTDETSNILTGFGGQINILSKTNGGPASARNAGIRASVGNLIAFTDSDCFPNEHWLQELVKGFHSPLVGGVGGTVRGTSDGLIGEYIDFHGWMNPQRASDGTVLSLVTANACFRHDVLLQASLFDERFRGAGGEDTELSIRVRSLGYELGFLETALVRHRHKATIWDYCKNIANHGEGRYVLEGLWSRDTGKRDHAKKIVRSLAGLGSMSRLYLFYRKQHDRKRAFFFSLLDHCQYVARIYGYRRGKRNVSAALLRRPLARGHGETSAPKDQSDSIWLPKCDAAE